MKGVMVVSASWCSQCGPYKRALDQAGIEYEEQDADDPENEALLKILGVRGLPTTIVFDGEIEVGRVVGNNVPKLRELLA